MSPTLLSSATLPRRRTFRRLSLRRQQPDLKRTFRVPGSPVVPILSALGALALILKGLPLQTMAAYLIWLVLGLVVYFGYSRRRSKVS